jgi:hypothetical protein
LPTPATLTTPPPIRRKWFWYSLLLQTKLTVKYVKFLRLLNYNFPFNFALRILGTMVNKSHTKIALSWKKSNFSTLLTDIKWIKCSDFSSISGGRSRQFRLL